MSIIQPRADATLQARHREWALAGLAAVILTLGAAVRLRLELSVPLWLDESWTGAIAAQPSIATLTEQVRDDANAPAYYDLIWAWAQVFGTGNVSLRLPSLMLSLVTPLVAWAGLRSSRPEAALCWAALLAAWLPGIAQAGDARCYALLSCTAVLASLAHLRLLEVPSHRRAATWTACAAFLPLVHYHAGLLALAQGLTVLAVHRRRALRLWPAALAFVPTFGWIAWHAPRLAEFARIDVAWYERLQIGDLVAVAVVLIGGPLTLISLVVALLVGCALKLDRSRGTARRDRDRADVALWWAGGAAVAAAAACVAVGVVRPTFTFRYLTPFAPGTALLAAACASRIGGTPYLTSGVLLGGPLLALVSALSPDPVSARQLYNFETASAWLAERRPSRLVFFWDHPATPVETPRQLDAVGGFFLRRAGLPLDVTPLYPTSADMNGPALQAAGSDAAVLWMYDTLIHHTSARSHPPRLASLDHGLECRDFGAYNIGVVACRR